MLQPQLHNPGKIRPGGRGWVMRWGGSRSSVPGAGDRFFLEGLKKGRQTAEGVSHKNKNFGPGSVQLWLETWNLLKLLDVVFFAKTQAWLHFVCRSSINWGRRGYRVYLYFLGCTQCRNFSPNLGGEAYPFAQVWSIYRVSQNYCTIFIYLKTLVCIDHSFW